ncbi:MAG: RIP metalloprotease RseP [Lactobacillaceae bacterium]|jgi:regulator of sigma E protease|nr:RIP metalloprotease RseP [Lactobacillaceae bacterium]
MDWLINTVYYVVPFIVLLGILVFVHEFGHFIIARILGVQVAEFSIGFGKTLWSRKDKKETLWKISAVPLGGYCKFLGDDDATSSTTDGEAASKLSEEQLKKAFFKQNPFKKLAIVLAGPGANYIFAVLVFASVFFFFGRVNFPPVVGDVMKGSAAEEAGIMRNDRILKINGNDINSFSDISKEVELHVNEAMVVEIKRGETDVTLKFPLKPVELLKEDGTFEQKTMLGVQSLNVVEVEKEGLSLYQSFKFAALETWDITMTTLRGVGQIITGKRSSGELGGVIRIAEMSGDISKQRGFIDFVIFTALLSINLGLINLFPIPLLDGGHVVIYVVEIATRREVNDRIKEFLFRLGFAFIIFLMVFATWNDVVRLFNRWFA